MDTTFNLILLALILIVVRFLADVVADRPTPVLAGAFGPLRTLLATVLLGTAMFTATQGKWTVAVPCGAAAILLFLARPRGAMATAGRRDQTWSFEDDSPDDRVMTGLFEFALNRRGLPDGGRVLFGRLRGRQLDGLSRAMIVELWLLAERDRRGRALLEDYMDRRDPLWREDLQHDSAARERRAPAAGAMSEDQAHQILGLQAGADAAAIRDAYRRLMMSAHPDRGGTTARAALINSAKDFLVRKHATRSNH
jgi:hypothetical protein